MYDKKQQELDAELSDPGEDIEPKKLKLEKPVFTILSTQNQLNCYPSESDSSDSSNNVAIYRLRENPIGIDTLTRLVKKAKLWEGYMYYLFSYGFNTHNYITI